ncbi:MAG: hypothetical protein QF384_15210 [Alphaproteobacteria bacterium]|nr:hypothetical protein [Alphaproteobacteria bacterium]MDP6831668.1 hypothetical protein [Alphaproteobacteria bacterium]
MSHFAKNFRDSPADNFIGTAIQPTFGRLVDEDVPLFPVQARDQNGYAVGDRAEFVGALFNQVLQMVPVIEEIFFRPLRLGNVDDGDGNALKVFRPAGDRHGHNDPEVIAGKIPVFYLGPKMLVARPDRDELVQEQVRRGVGKNPVQGTQKFFLRGGTKQAQRRFIDLVDIDTVGQSPNGVGMFQKVGAEILNAFAAQTLEFRKDSAKVLVPEADFRLIKNQPIAPLSFPQSFLDIPLLCDVDRHRQDRGFAGPIDGVNDVVDPYLPAISSNGLVCKLGWSLLSA